jgi:hypothetical protein
MSHCGLVHCEWFVWWVDETSQNSGKSVKKTEEGGERERGWEKINIKLSTDYLLYIWKNNVCIHLTFLLYATCNIQCKIDMYLRIRVPSKKNLRIRETRAAAPTFVVTSICKLVRLQSLPLHWRNMIFSSRACPCGTYFIKQKQSLTGYNLPK